MLHRPGDELKRLTPRNNDQLLFDGIPWVARAQDEHDAFADALRARDVEVLYLTELLTETLEQESARQHAITTALSGLHLGDTMRTYLAARAQRRDPGRAHGVPHRGHPQRRGPRRPRPGDRAARPARLPDRPAAEPAVHPRLQRVGARPGRGHVAGDAGPPPRDPADRADLHRAPALRRHPQDPRLAPRARRGRRRPAARARRDRGRRRRAHHARRRRAARPAGLPRRARPHRAGRADRPGARHDAPRHRLHDGRRRQDRDVPQRRRLAAGVRRDGRPSPGSDEDDAARCTSPTPSRSWSRPRRRWASTRSTRSTPVSTR